MEFIGILSGKGGVGKTTFAANLAYELFLRNNDVGILDIDIHTPNIPLLFNTQDKELKTENSRIIPITIEKSNNILEVVSTYYLTTNAAIIWRGPIKHQIIQQFLDNTNWHAKKIIVDFPPGTGDEVISFAQLIKQKGDFKAIIVSMPTESSLADAKRAFDFCNKMNLPVIGVVENMSSEFFGEGTVKDFADENSLTYLGKIRLSKEIKKNPVFVKYNTEESKNFKSIVDKIE